MTSFTNSPYYLECFNNEFKHLLHSEEIQSAEETIKSTEKVLNIS